MDKLYSKSENYLNFTIEVWYRESTEAWFYEIRKEGNFIKSNWYGLVSSGAAMGAAKEYIDAESQFANGHRFFRVHYSDCLPRDYTEESKLLSLIGQAQLDVDVDKAVSNWAIILECYVVEWEEISEKHRVDIVFSEDDFWVINPLEQRQAS